MVYHNLRPMLPLLALALAPSPTWGVWIPDGVPLCGSRCGGGAPIVIPDGSGGAFVAWRDGRMAPVTGEDVYLQRITAAGDLAPGWPTEGLPVCVLPTSQEPWSLAPDGEGGAFVVWTDFRDSPALSLNIYAQRVRSDGTLAPGWPENGAPVCRAPDYQTFPVIASDGAGGAFLAWEDWRDYVTAHDVYAQHLTATGSVAPGWPLDGLRVCSFISGIPRSILADGGGGVVVTWADARRGGGFGGVDAYAQRLMADGSIAPGWVENGMLVLQNRTAPLAVPDGAGGFYLAAEYVSPVTASPVEYTAQRFTFQGTLAPGWPAAGVQVCAAEGNRENLRIAEDGMGGLLAAWYDYRAPQGGSDVYAAHVLPDGSLAPGWPPHGLLVSDPAEPLEFDVDIAADGVGGAYVAWEWEIYNVGRPSRLQHLAADGTVAPGWPAFGVLLASTRGQFTPRLAPDGAGGVIAAWEEVCCGRLGIFAQRFGTDGPVPVQLALVSANATPDLVTLLWQGKGTAALEARVERRTEWSGWQSVGVPVTDGPDRLRFEDRDVMPGSRYAYRLAYRDGGAELFTAETWVEVPIALSLNLFGFSPNPAHSALTVAFTLPSTQPATLELLDLGGRRLISRGVNGLGPGNHVVTLQEADGLPAGAYWVRLTQSGRSLVTKGVLVR